MAGKATFDKKWLAGLKFTGLVTEKTKDDRGEVVEKRVSKTRDLTEADVLDWKDSGSAVVLVTADGKKHRVQK